MIQTFSCMQSSERSCLLRMNESILLAPSHSNSSRALPCGLLLRWVCWCNQQQQHTCKCLRGTNLGQATPGAHGVILRHSVFQLDLFWAIWVTLWADSLRFVCPEQYLVGHCGEWEAVQSEWGLGAGHDLEILHIVKICTLQWDS